MRLFPLLVYSFTYSTAVYGAPDTVTIKDINVNSMVSFCNVADNEPYFYETDEVPAQGLLHRLGSVSVY